MLPSVLIVDNFLADPMAARQAALALDYDPGFKKGNYPGLLSTRPLAIGGLDDAVAGLIGRPVRPQPGTSHGHCRLTLAREKGRSGVHIDPCFYSGILFLTLPEHCRGGTDFYRHRRTGLDRVPEDRLDMVRAGYDDPNRLVEEVVNQDTLKPSRWERSFTAPMRFNRLLLFSPWMFHNSGAGFGDRPDNGRLVHLMFFAAA
ncbi:hypothetical protein GCM10023232_24310 [Sphingosinicella ginsenosidimutans]|jgi:hypothetical protein|uniref:Phytanoyl-CoA dioxygenase family protein n=1 Tax=Allosphingosinicella ginsenosidimutans TaxID=1176539 RepID=A0A5C6TTJ1_9SPHN|nr:DUF6445 family protein [Sphingosinicella ginsenosidimutans]TXC63647.1 hypothetical protein FRZ32_08225 [Sphingosinicella ginsenosidimutans]